MRTVSHLPLIQAVDTPGGCASWSSRTTSRWRACCGAGCSRTAIAADVAATGHDALWMATAVEYDAIVLDVMLPGIDGFEVCRRLRRRGRLVAPC